MGRATDVAQRARRICVVTGTRAEFGLLAPLMSAIEAAPDMQLQVVAAAAHLVPAFGLTRDEIIRRGFVIDRQVDMLMAGDSEAAIARSIGLGTIQFATAFEDLAPDMIVVLGDRFEILAAATAAAVMGIPVAHLHGGEVTVGAVDDAIRNAVTKLSRLHFTAAEPYRRRVIQMGEPPATVFNVGAIGLDAIDRAPVLERAAVADQLGLDLRPPVLLVTFHPPTAEGSGRADVEALIEALDAFPEATVIITGVNADAGHDDVARALAAYAARRPGRVTMRASLGQVLYTNAIRQCDAVVGNSSSGIIEAPYLRKPTVDIGRRQEGRLKAASIISAPAQAAAIRDAIARALSPQFRKTLADVVPCYGGGEVANRIVAAMRETIGALAAPKIFHDLPE